MKEVELTEEEKAQIEASRKKNEIKEELSNKMLELLKEYKAGLVVDPNSPIGNPQIIIVDEPTAGLDPEESNRFLNLLSEIGENVIVILSTHIVEDVSNLCPNMAIQVQGEIIASGAPSELTATLSNTLWQATINKAQLAEYQQRHQVISHRLVAGKVQIHVVNPICPTAEFSPVTPDLEDVYFFLLAKHNLKSEQKKLNLEPIISKVKDQEYSEVV